MRREARPDPRRAVVLSAALFATGLAIPAHVRAQDASEPANPVCASEVHRGGRFELRQVGPLIEGRWNERAIGMGFTSGVQTSQVDIMYDRNRDRLYLSSGGVQVELVPVRGEAKPLRWDYRKSEKLDPEHRIMVPEPFEWAIVFDCDLAFAPQFTWQMGAGANRSDGIVSFFSSGEAMGVKWNSARGTREQHLSR